MTQTAQTPLLLTPGMGSVGSITPRDVSSSSSDLDPLTGASGVGGGRPRSSPDGDPHSFESSPVSDRDRTGDSAVPDQENQLPSWYGLCQQPSSGSCNAPDPELESLAS